ncbi:hypothetical protein AMTRI_Chr05g65350 [Amborella trichopoda]
MATVNLEKNPKNSELRGSMGEENPKIAECEAHVHEENPIIPETKVHVDGENLRISETKSDADGENPRNMENHGIEKEKSASVSSSCPENEAKNPKTKKQKLEILGYSIEGLSIGGQETCIMFPNLKLAFDIGRCPQRAINQDFLFISHGHMDHIGGLPMYVATRGLYRMKPPTIFVPASIKQHVEKLFEVHRAMDDSELKHNLIGLKVGEEFQFRRDLIVRAFKTYHVIPSQGYIIYSVKQKLKKEYVGLSGNDIKRLKFSGVEITDTVLAPEVAFTGDTMADFIVDPDNVDALKAKILVMESTFVDSMMTVEHAREYGHTHLFEIAKHADKFENRAILLIHFSARYRPEEIEAAVAMLPRNLDGRVFALTDGF